MGRGGSPASGCRALGNRADQGGPCPLRENVKYTLRTFTSAKDRVFTRPEKVLWKSSFLSPGGTLLPVPTFTTVGRHLRENLKLLLKLALMLAFQGFYKRPAPREPEVVLGLGRG